MGRFVSTGEKKPLALGSFKFRSGYLAASPLARHQACFLVIGQNIIRRFNLVIAIPGHTAAACHLLLRSVAITGLRVCTPVTSGHLTMNFLPNNRHTLDVLVICEMKLPAAVHTP